MKSKIRRIGKSKVDILNDANSPLDSRVALIQMLIPLGIKAVQEELERELMSLVGEKHSRANDELVRWGKNPGSVYLGDQKVAVEVPRLRNKITDDERPLTSYQALQNPQVIESHVLSQVINGLSQRRYEESAFRVAETFGISGSSVSRKFIRSSARKLQELMSRDLSEDDFLVLFMDGKRFAETGMVVVIGVTITGEKKVLGFVETAGENAKVIGEFLSSLMERGFKVNSEILVVLDGAKGLTKGVKMAFGEKAIIQRCQFHKIENVVSYLPKRQQEMIRQKLKLAYASETYGEAKETLDKIKKELKLMNQSALASLEEGFEETLTLHRLGVFKEIGKSLKTTNCIESILSQVAQYTDRVDYWKNSNQRQRWLASALIEVEKNIRKIRGHQYLPLLRQAMRQYAVNENKKCA